MRLYHGTLIRVAAAATMLGVVARVWAEDPPKPAGAAPVAVQQPVGAKPVTPATPGTTATPGATATPAAPAKPGTGPQIVFDTPTYDFGKVMAGEPIRHDFWFTNRGNATLEVVSVRPGCGCTTAGDWDRRVEPGKTGKIPISLRTEKMNAPVQKTVTVTTNVPGQADVVLWLKGTIWAPVDVQPPYVNMGSIIDGKAKSQVVKVTNRLDEKIDLKNVKSSNPVFRVEVKPVTAGKEYDVTVTAMPPFTIGAQTANITMDTGATKYPTVTITATAYVPPAVEVQPARLMVPTPITADKELAVYVTYNAGADLKISEIKVNNEKIQTRLAEDQPGKRFRVILKFPAGTDLPTSGSLNLTFNTTHESAKVITVPIQAVQMTPNNIARTAPNIPMNRPIVIQNQAGRPTTTQPAAAARPVVAPSGGH